MIDATSFQFVMGLMAISQQRADLGFYTLREAYGDDFCVKLTQEQRNMFISEVDNAWRIQPDGINLDRNLIALTADNCGLPEQQPDLNAKQLVNWLVDSRPEGLLWKSSANDDWVKNFPCPASFVHRHVPGGVPTVDLAFDGMLPLEERRKYDHTRSLFARTVVSLYFKEGSHIQETGDGFFLQGVRVSVGYENVRGQHFPDSGVGDITVSKDTGHLLAANLH